MGIQRYFCKGVNTVFRHFSVVCLFVFHALHLIVDLFYDQDNSFKSVCFCYCCMGVLSVFVVCLFFQLNIFLSANFNHTKFTKVLIKYQNE